MLKLILFHTICQALLFTLCTVVVQLISCVWLLVTLWTAACQACLSSTISQSLLKFVPTELVMPSNYLILCCPILLWPSVFLSIRVFSSELALCIGWPTYWSFGSSPSNKYSELINVCVDISKKVSESNIYSCTLCSNTGFSMPWRDILLISSRWIMTR